MFLTLYRQKLEKYLAPVIDKIKNEKYNSKVEQIYEIRNAITKAIEYSNKPEIIVQEISNFAFKDEFESFYSSMKDENVIIMHEIDNLDSIISNLSVQVENLVNVLSKSSETNNNDESNIQTIREEFYTLNNLDLNVIPSYTDPVQIFNNYKGICLKTKTIDDATKDCKVTIDYSYSNGFPGNLHEARISNNRIKFIGESDPKVKKEYIIDDDVNTWFEFEGYIVPRNVVEEYEGFGFKTAEGVDWVLKQPQLKLKLDFMFEQPRLLNTVTIIPYIVNGCDYLLHMVETEDESGIIKQTMINRSVLGNSNIVLPVNRYRRVSLYLIQNKGYSTQAGLVTYKTLSGKYVSGPKYPSLSVIGLRYDKLSRTILGTDSIIDNEVVKKEFFNLQYSSADMYAEYELIECTRFAIGIRGIKLQYIEFETQGIFISKPVEISSDSKRIWIESMTNNLNFTKYYVSIDNGQTWIEIKPKNLSVVPNQVVVFDSLHTGIQAAMPEKPVLRVKIELTTDNPASTPVVDYYTVYIERSS